MKLFFEDILPPILLFAMAFLMPAIFVGRRRDKQKAVPATVKAAAFCETVFGIMLLFYSIYAMVHHNPDPASWFPPGYIFLIGFALTLFWFVMASALSQGVPRSRKVCLVMSILRIPTIIGIMFSAIDIYLLYFTRQSCEFFTEASPRQEVGQDGQGVL